MAERLKILITGGGTTTAVSSLKGLRITQDPTLHITMGDMSPECAGAHLGDDFVVLPSATKPGFDERVVELCGQHRFGLVIPIIDHEFAGWSRVRDRLRKKGTEVVISSTAALEQCQEKDRTFQLFQRLGIPTIQTWRAAEIDDPSRLPYPVYMKPRCGRASLDNYQADNLDEYRMFIAKVDDAIVQPLTKGVEVTIDCLNDLQGRFLAAAPRIRLQVKSGQAYRSRTFRDAALEAMAGKVAAALPIVGPCNMQCFLTDAGPRFFEINARFGAGSVLSMQAGMNGPAALVAMVRGEPLPSLESRAGVDMLRYWQEVFTEA